MTFPDHVSCYHKLGSEPKENADSFTLDVLILSERHQRPAARCEEDIVVYDYRKGTKTPLPPFVMNAFKQTWELQEAARKRNSKRLKELLGRMKALERDTWDRSDAVEDLGSASA